MKITDVRIRPINSERSLLAVATIVIDGCFAVHGVRVIDGSQGPFVAMPSRKGTDGQYHDIAHPTTAEARELIASRVLAAYRQSTGEGA